jgi:hypothetical protein
MEIKKTLFFFGLFMKSFHKSPINLKTQHLPFNDVINFFCKIFEYNPDTWNNANDQSHNLHSQLQDYTKNHSMNGCKNLIILQLH